MDRERRRDDHWSGKIPHALPGRPVQGAAGTIDYQQSQSSTILRLLALSWRRRTR